MQGDGPSQKKGWAEEDMAGSSKDRSEKLQPTRGFGPRAKTDQNGET